MKEHLQHLNKMPSHPVVLEAKEYAQQIKLQLFKRRNGIY